MDRSGGPIDPLRMAKEKLAVSQTSIFPLGFTFKKSLHAAEQHRPDVAAARRAWFKMLPTMLDPRRLVFIDGTGARDERLVCKVHNNKSLHRLPLNEECYIGSGSS